MATLPIRISDLGDDPDVDVALRVSEYAWTWISAVQPDVDVKTGMVWAYLVLRNGAKACEMPKLTTRDLTVALGRKRQKPGTGWLTASDVEQAWQRLRELGLLVPLVSTRGGHQIVFMTPRSILEESIRDAMRSLYPHGEPCSKMGHHRWHRFHVDRASKAEYDAIVEAHSARWRRPTKLLPPPPSNVVRFPR